MVAQLLEWVDLSGRGGKQRRLGGSLGRRGHGGRRLGRLGGRLGGAGVLLGVGRGARVAGRLGGVGGGSRGLEGKLEAGFSFAVSGVLRNEMEGC